jgi:hypothetical protein
MALDRTRLYKEEIEMVERAMQLAMDEFTPGMRRVFKVELWEVVWVVM